MEQQLVDVSVFVWLIVYGIPAVMLIMSIVTLFNASKERHQKSAAEAAGLKSDIYSLKEDITDIKADLTEVKEGYHKNDKRIATIDSRVSQLERRMTALEKEVRRD